MLSHRNWTWRDAYRLPIAIVLWPFVLRNYWLRKHGRVWDDWYWADCSLASWGYFV